MQPGLRVTAGAASRETIMFKPRAGSFLITFLVLVGAVVLAAALSL